MLVLAGTSGVGSAAIQIARDRGARVFATAGSAAKMALARNLAQPLATESEPVRVQRVLEDALLSVLEEAYGNVPAVYRT